MVELSHPGPFQRFILRGPGHFERAMPTQPMRALEGGDLAALWLGPDEWLLIARREGTIANRPGDGSYALVDVSHRQVAFMLTGDDAARLLNGAVPLDLAESAFPIGMCTCTIFEKAEIVLWRRAASQWHIEVARSFAPYVHDLLTVIASSNAIPLAIPEN